MTTARPIHNPGTPATLADRRSDAMRILMFTTEYPPMILGGLCTHVRELVGGLLALGHTLDVICWSRVPHQPIQGPRLYVQFVHDRDNAVPRCGIPRMRSLTDAGFQSALDRSVPD